jgi:hypothetical protein
VVGLKIAELLLNNIHIWRNENEEKDGPFLPGCSMFMHKETNCSPKGNLLFFVDTRPCIFLIDSNVWKYDGKKA